MYMGPNVIKSLTFRTNRGKHGPYGEEQGPSFTHQIDEGKVVGFLGREGLFLDSIGVHVMECKISSLKPSSPHNAIVPHNNSGTVQIENSPWANKLVLAANGHGEEVTCRFHHHSIFRFFKFSVSRIAANVKQLYYGSVYMVSCFNRLYLSQIKTCGVFKSFFFKFGFVYLD